MRFCFASTRSVQIATGNGEGFIVALILCLHTLRADCNGFPPARGAATAALPPHAPCRLQQQHDHQHQHPRLLCLHTLRADCNQILQTILPVAQPLPPHAPCRLQHNAPGVMPQESAFASTRSVQIATRGRMGNRHSAYLCLHTLRADCNAAKTQLKAAQKLCLHTLRADCNQNNLLLNVVTVALPPHAPCRLQLQSIWHTAGSFHLCLHTLRADCNLEDYWTVYADHLCLHTLRADCNSFWNK